jgi:phosphoglycerol transferase MdoB-like AlkP superfamily enzyme
MCKKENSYEYFVSWWLFFSVIWFFSRLPMSTDESYFSLANMHAALMVTAIDAVFPALLALIAVAPSMIYPQSAPFSRILVLIAWSMFLLVNSAAIAVKWHFNRLLCKGDFAYILEPSFMSGSVFSFANLPLFGLAFVLPFVLTLAALFLFKPGAVFNRPLRNLFIIVILLLPSLMALRKIGYSSPYPRASLVSASIYFHSLFTSTHKIMPLQRDELVALRNYYPAFPGNRNIEPNRTAERMNVLFVIMESMRFFESNNDSTLPHLKKAEQMGLTLQNFHVRKASTSGTIWSIFTGMPDGIDYVAFRKIPLSTVSMITDSLSAGGYRNLWFHGNVSTFDNRSTVFKKHALNNLFDFNVYPNARHELGWGVPDIPFFSWSIERIDSVNQAESSPWFAVMLSISCHHPFNVPDEFKTKPAYKRDERTIYRDALRYSDSALGIVLDHYEKASWKERTMVIIVGDHGYETPQDRIDSISTSETWLHVPCVLIGPEFSPSSVDTLPAGPQDIAATIMHSSLGFEKWNRGSVIHKDRKFTGLFHKVTKQDTLWSRAILSGQEREIWSDALTHN